MPPNIIIHPEHYSDRAKELLDNGSALICFLCADTLNGAAAKGPPAPAAASAPLPPLPSLTNTDFVSSLTNTDSDNANKRKSVDNVKSNLPPKKKKDSELYSHFTIVEYVPGSLAVSCNHCNSFNKVVTKFNATFARNHLTGPCVGIDQDTKSRLYQGSQKNRRGGKEYALMMGPTHSLHDMRESALREGNTFGGFEDLSQSPKKTPSVGLMKSTVTPGSSRTKSTRATVPKHQPALTSTRMFGARDCFGW